MEEEIDLKPYIEALITKWYWIMGAAILAGVVAFIVSSALPPKYQATALVAVTQPTRSWNLTAAFALWRTISR
ncbi:MAG: Wzz/FepE/Etk N-terminal domain-containing protein [Chloroflexi bacterium]|nr:Wzz/FepE/Etk N-terminal domain-containing protein [Chloroflexota bacterium]